MKIQEYCKVTERVKPDPQLKARVMMKAEQLAAGSAAETEPPQRGRIRQHISGRAIGGTAVAAAVAAANIGIISAVIHAKNSGSANPAASEIEEIQFSVPDYVKCMQELYAMNGEPCTYDFTGCGEDLDYHWEFSDYRINLRAAAGDAFTVYFFYDVIPLKGQTYYGTNFNYEPLMCYVESETALTAFYSNRFDISLTGSEEQGLKPDVLSITQDGKNGGEVWHFYDSTTNPTDLGFCGKEFFATVDSRFSEDTQGETYDSSNLKKSFELNFIQQPVWQEIDTTNAPEFAELGFTRATVTPMNVMLSSGEHDAAYYESLLNFTTENEPHAELECLTVQLPCTAQTVNGAVNVEYTGSIGFSCRDASGRDDPLTMLLQMQTPLDLTACKSLTLRDAVIPVNPDLPDEPAVTPVSDDQQQTAPNYVKLMQQAFDTDMDFTGCGEECYQTWTVDDAEIRLKALCGDRYNLFYFYEIEGYDTDSLRLAVCPARLDEFFPDKICESRKCLSEKTAEDGKKTVLMFCDMNGIADMQNAVPLSYQQYGLNAVPYRLTNGEYIEAGEPQYVSSDFLDTENALTPVSLSFRQGCSVNGKTYKYAFITPFGIRLMNDTAENMIANNIKALAMSSQPVRDFTASFAEDDSTAAQFTQFPVQYCSEITFGAEESDYQTDILAVRFEKPVDLKNAKLFDINGTVQVSEFEHCNMEMRMSSSQDECFSSGNVNMRLIPHPENIPEDAQYTLTIDAIADGGILYQTEASLINDGTAEIPFAFTLPEDFTGDQITVTYAADNYDYGGQFILSKSNPD